MKFGIFYELQLPKPWGPDDERRLVQDALAQVELADRLGIDYAWAVEHHFLEEYSHCSASEVFLAAAAARTKRIRLGHGIRQVIANYNHPARTAEAVAMLDLVSNGRADFGIGEGATRLELGGFNIPAKEKRAMSLEAAEQIANMMVMEPYPGFEGRSFKMPVPQRAAEAACRSRIRRCGWPAPTATPSRSRPAWASARSPSPSSTRRRRAPGARSTTTSSRATPACRSATASTPTSPWSRPSRCTRTAAEAVAARPGGLRVLPLRHQRAGHRRRGARPLAAVGASSRSSARAARWPPTYAGTEDLAGAFQRSPGIGTPDRLPRRTCAPSRTPASTRSSCCSRPAATAHAAHLRLARAVRRATCCPSSRPKAAERERAQGRGAGALHRQGPGAQEGAWRPLADADIPVVRASVAKPAVNQSQGLLRRSTFNMGPLDGIRIVDLTRCCRGRGPP